MANGTVDQLNPAEPRPTKCKKQGRYYDPPTSIVLVPGVTLEREPWQDIYVGSADDLASSGLLDRKLFPGEQGRPRNAVSLRARGVEKGAAYWHMTPG